MKNNNSITVSPHLRLTLAGFRLRIKSHSNKFKLILMRGDEQVAIAEATRSASLTNLQALHKAQNNSFGPSSDFYQKLTELADLAEALAATTL